MGKENNLQGLTSKEVKDRVEKGLVNTQEKSATARCSFTILKTW